MLYVIEAGFLTTIQDRGRYGWARYGVPASGPMDSAAFDAANRLVANQPDAAGLEITLTGPTLQAAADCLIAVCGAEFELRVGSLDVPTWHAVFVRAGDRIVFGERRSGMRAYLAAAGGIEVPTFLGSRATYLPGQFGGMEGRRLETGDRLQLGTPQVRSLFEQAGQAWPHKLRPPYRPDSCVRVILGPQDDYFASEALALFLQAEFHVTPNSDRMGLRLNGPALRHRNRTGIVSDGVTSGSIQVPPDGHPIVMMVDHQTTGGYPKIATVISEDLPLLAQMLPGDSVRFSAAELAP